MSEKMKIFKKKFELLFLYLYIYTSFNCKLLIKFDIFSYRCISSYPGPSVGVVCDLREIRHIEF